MAEEQAKEGGPSPVVDAGTVEVTAAGETSAAAPATVTSEEMSAEQVEAEAQEEAEETEAAAAEGEAPAEGLQEDKEGVKEGKDGKKKEKKEKAARPAGSVKIFVGQCGRYSTDKKVLKEDKGGSERYAPLETDVKAEAMFFIQIQYGKVVEVKIIEDKQSKKSKGCAFILLSNKKDADKAISQLSGKHQMPGMTNFLQLSYAKGEQERLDAKLFVSMIAKTSTKEDIEKMVKPFGNIEEVFLIKDKQTKAFNGSAFVRFTTKKEAVAAIDGLHGKLTMEGSSQPLVVKWADQDKKDRGNQGGNMMNNQMGMRGMGNMGMGMGNMGMGNMGMGNMGMGMGMSPMMMQQQMLMMQQQQQMLMMQQQQMRMAQMGGGMNRGGFGSPQRGGIRGGIGAIGSPRGGGGMRGGRGAMMGSGPAGTSDSSGISVHGMPIAWGEEQLAQCFAPFGTVVNSSVMRDPSGLSKGVGMIQFDNVQSASNAVEGMNGLQIEGRRLRVEHRRRGPAMPY